MILSNSTKNKSKKIFNDIIDWCVDFKLRDKVISDHIAKDTGLRLVTKLPITGKSVEEVVDEFKKTVLPYCTNFGSKNFMSFPDSGNSTAAIAGSLIFNFLQQNLINQTFCAPSATFIEIAVIQWFREIVGYKNNKIKNIWDVGGMITPGGTGSNTIAMMLAREHKVPGTMQNGVKNTSKYHIIVPKGIGHYSVKSAQMWIGCGNKLIEVKTNNFRYDLEDLKKTLIKYKGKIMCVVAYVGDSRTMTVDNLDAVAKTVKSIDSSVWLHADACHGFSLGFSEKLKYKLKGLEKFDSISTDPHKVLMTPYTISVLLVKNPESLKTITSLSDLIMQEDFAFGQITPFLGSKPWDSLKLWFLLKNLGKTGVEQIINERHRLAKKLAEILQKDKDFIVLNEVEINAVCFMYVGNINPNNVELLNNVNKKIHSRIVEIGDYHLHTFSIPDAGVIKRGEKLCPLRYMSGNPIVKEKDLHNLVSHVKCIGQALTNHAKKTRITTSL